MEPVIVGGMARLAAAAVQRSSAPVRGAKPPWPEWDEESDERGGLVLNDLQGSPLALLTQDQVEQIREFVEKPEAIALTQFMLITRLGVREEDRISDLVDDYRETFAIQAEEFCDEHGYIWANLARDVWDLISAHMDSVFPSRQALAHISHSELERVSAYVGSTEKLEGKTRAANAAFREIVDILGNPQRFEASRNLISDIRNASERHYAELNLTHALSHSVDNFRFDQSALYVPRTLRLKSTEDYCSDDFLTSPSGRPRCVVVGDPGVGKSTMTQHLVHQLSSAEIESDAYATAVVSCKDVPNSEGSAYIPEAIARSIKENLQIDTGERDVNDLATLGRLFVMFDGIDEIVDIGRRRTFIRTIEAFAARYPLTPILVTARRVGYSKAPFRDEFSVYELDDFSDEQVEEYTRRWFEATSRSAGERESFIRETENVPDVRKNPLMLSLLCALYRARGYIPRNRREVYKSCADLLFQRWDAMRQIEQPVDHRQYGTRLMQELALFFYKSQSAQSGVQEQQLRKIIAQFFTDTASVDEEDAKTRAQGFLDFCAERAWLLTFQGTDSRDQRLFGFTHRTFMEYFAAEAIVRRSRGIEEIVKEVADAYEKDSSSVLADVIFQCADDKYEGGAREVVSELMEKARGLGWAHAPKYISLCLRIMNSAPLPPRSTDLIFSALFQHWGSSTPNSSYGSAVALFDLYRDPRSRFVATLRENREWAEAALLRWARIYWRGEASIFDPAWSEDMLSVASDFQFGTVSDGPLFAYLLDKGVVTLDEFESVPPAWLVSVYAYDDVYPGPLFSDLQRHVWESAPSAGGVISAAWQLGIFPTEMSSAVLYRAAKEFSRWLPTISFSGFDAAHEYSADFAFVLWVCAFLYEDSASSYHEFHELVDFVYGKEWFDRAADTRTHGAESGASDYCDPFSNAELGQLEADGRIPEWFSQWCLGTRSFVADDDY